MGGIDPMKALAKARSDIYSFNPFDLVLIGVDHGDSKHPLFDRRVHNPPDERMIVSFAENGQIEPVVFRIEEINGKWAPVIVEGRQRVINARELTRRREAKGEPPFLLKAVKNETAKGSDHKAIGIMVSANTIRTQYAEIEEAELAQRMMGEYGYDEESCAKHFGVSVATLNRRIAVAQATDEVRHAYVQGEIPMGAAVELAKLQPAEQRAAVEQVKATATQKQEKLAARKGGKGKAPETPPASDKAASEPKAKPSKAGAAATTAKAIVAMAGVQTKHREHLRSIKQVRALAEHVNGEVPCAKDRETYEAIRTILGWVQGDDQLGLALLLEKLQMEIPKGASDR